MPPSILTRCFLRPPSLHPSPSWSVRMSVHACRQKGMMFAASGVLCMRLALGPGVTEREHPWGPEVKRSQRSTSKRRFISLPDTPSPSLHPPPFLFDTAIFAPSYSTTTRSYRHNSFNHAVRQRVVNKRNQACDTSTRHYFTQQHINLTTTHNNLTLLHIQQWHSERPHPTLPSSGIDCPTCTKFSVARPSRPSICSASTSTCAMPNAASTISISGTHSLHRLPEHKRQN
jgi:hypothetical protein